MIKDLIRRQENNLRDLEDQVLGLQLIIKMKKAEIQELKEKDNE